MRLTAWSVTLIAWHTWLIQGISFVSRFAVYNVKATAAMIEEQLFYHRPRLTDWLTDDVKPISDPLHGHGQTEVTVWLRRTGHWTGQTHDDDDDDDLVCCFALSAHSGVCLAGISGIWKTKRHYWVVIVVNLRQTTIVISRRRLCV